MRFLIHDRDSESSGTFRSGVPRWRHPIVQTPVRAPKANTTAERLVRTVDAECLDWLLILNRRHLERVLRAFVAHHNKQRPARCAQAPATRTRGAHRRPQPSARSEHDRLGGPIHEYSRTAA
jgi:putative transposase